MALGRLPRLSAFALACSLVPTTIAGHPFWDADDDAKPGQKIHFLKNVSMLGGLLLAMSDHGPANIDTEPGREETAGSAGGLFPGLG